jgi:hypothetical protein
MTLRTLAAACGAVLFAQFAVSPAAIAADAPSRWVATWATALQSIPQQANLPPLYRAPEVAGRTVRQIVYPTLSGNTVRVHLSNEYGKTPLVVQALRIARSGGGAAQSNGGVAVTFGGKEAVTVPPGGELDSDAATLEIVAGAPYAISSYMGAEQRLVAWHRVSNQVNYVSLPGNHTDDAMSGAFHQRFTQFAWVTGLSVEAPSAAAVAAIGDSITDGRLRSSIWALAGTVCLTILPVTAMRWLSVSAGTSSSAPG